VSEKTNQHSQEEYDVDYENADNIDDDAVLIGDYAGIGVRYSDNCQVFVSASTELYGNGSNNRR